MHAFRNVVDPALAAEYRAQGWWGDETLADVVRRHAAERPDATAFVADAGRLTWSGYDRAADRLAAALAGAGLPAGARVGVWLPDSATVHVAFLAAERAGLTVVGVGARAGARELRHLLGTTGAEALVTLATHRGQSTVEVVAGLARDGLALRHVVVPLFEAGGDQPILVDGEEATPAELDSDRRLGPDDLFLINSTSGTTGLPKCVLHHQNRWMYFHRKAVAHGDLGPDDVFLGAVPAPFGFGLWTAHFTPTLLGVPTVVSERFDPAWALDAIETERVTVLCCVSTQFIMMLNQPDVAERDLSSLRVMFTGGEAVPYDRARAFEERTGCTVLQFFGSNETGLLSGTTLADPPERRLRTAGRVVPEMQVRLYEDGRDVTERGWGQPACRGPATCLGYLGDEDNRSGLYTPDGWMLMGDICTLDDEGYLTVTGRLSDIIIRGGKNISAAQVEDEVSTHPAVALAAAVARPDPTFGERVWVYVELHPGAELTFDDLIAHLDARGTSKEIRPEHLVVLDRLPRSSGGKVAKGDLRQRAAAGIDD
ncbi:MAG TPA: class I adenylate-forming enzyme family protein [Acidimicrobiales bacterium]